MINLWLHAIFWTSARQFPSRIFSSWPRLKYPSQTSFFLSDFIPSLLLANPHKIELFNIGRFLSSVWLTADRISKFFDKVQNHIWMHLSMWVANSKTRERQFQGLDRLRINYYLLITGLRLRSLIRSESGFTSWIYWIYCLNGLLNLITGSIALLHRNYILNLLS